ncbi:ubiquitin thioesterase Otu1 isoform X2 [Onthophagus taurus]|nr:ubiquitin thioesterase OTU1 isoform X2 [Onthophagus taurus]
MTTFALKIKTKVGQEVVRSLTPDSTIADLKTVLAKIGNIPENRLCVLSGFPPKVLDLSGDAKTSLKEKGITSGDTLILEEKIGNITSNTSASSLKNEADEQFALQSNSTCPGLLMKYVVPADNSCLFTSIHFVLNGKVDETGSVAPWMRELIAETVERESDEFTEAILGKPPAEYCKWILDEKSWGGAIELAILSSYYGIEIAVVDTINAIINRFGEDKNYGNRVFLLFDGIHYDPLYLEPTDGGPIKTIFPSQDVKLLEEAELLAKEAKSSRQFTDVNKFRLKCNVCNIFLNGQVEAQSHAQSTGHTNFGEV